MGGIPVAVAIIVGLVSSFIQSLGLTIQRKSHVKEDLLPPELRKRPIRRPLWLVGFAIYITSNVFSTVFQLDALPIVILAPLGAVSLIFNALLAKILLGDHFGTSSIVGTGLVTVGAVLIAVFGVVQEEEHSLKDLLVLWRRPAFLAFFSIVAAAVTILLVTAHTAAWHIKRQLRPGRIALSGSDTPPESLPPSNYASPHDPPPIPFKSSLKSRRWSLPVSPSATASALGSALAPLANGHTETEGETEANGVDVKRPAPRHVHFVPSVRKSSTSTLLQMEMPPLVAVELVQPDAAQQRTLTLVGLAFASASGTLSGMSLVLAKAAVELLVITIHHFRTGKGENQFLHAQSWFLVAGLGIGAILQLVYLNYSLTFASPALICPLAFCFFNLSSIFDGLVFYDQFGQLKPYQIALVSIGVAVLLLGVWVVSLIRPEGDGGIDVGTWVEEEDACDGAEPGRAEEDGLFLPGDRLVPSDRFDEPAQDAMVPPTQDMPSKIPESASVEEGTTPSPQRKGTSSRRSSSIPPSPLSPTSGASLASPLSPLSPGTAPKRRHPPRYGTLMPEYAPIGAPTGFSIGLGAASPGFVLRSSSLNNGHRRSRTQSEGQAGLIAIIGEHGLSASPESTHRASADEAMTHTRVSDDGREGHPESGDEEGGGEVRDGHGRRQSWWRNIWENRNKGAISLPPDDER